MKSILISLFSLILITACSSHEIIEPDEPTPSKGRTLTLKASMPDDNTSTKLAITEVDQNISVRWKEGDMINLCIEKMAEADGIIIGSPTYFADLTPETKALIDRAGFVAKANGDMFRRKVGAAVVAVRRAGAIHVFDSINHLFFISQMIVAGSSYWNIGLGREEKDVENDEEGLATMRKLGENMAWLINRIKD